MQFLNLERLKLYVLLEIYINIMQNTNQYIWYIGDELILEGKKVDLDLFIKRLNFAFR